MKTLLKMATVAAVMAGAAFFASEPARADGVSVSIGVPGIGFSYDSGGYCDSWGCPSDYWGYPVYYGPVYWGGAWYRGPVYYRHRYGHTWYWVHGGWHRDQWRGPRPHWYRHNYRYGPALGYDYYRGHGFRHDRDRYWRHERREHRRDFRHERREHRRELLRERREHRRDFRRDRREDRRAIRHDRRDDRRDHRRDRAITTTKVGLDLPTGAPAIRGPFALWQAGLIQASMDGQFQRRGQALRKGAAFAPAIAQNYAVMGAFGPKISPVPAP